MEYFLFLDAIAFVAWREREGGGGGIESGRCVLTILSFQFLAACNCSDVL